MLLKVLTKKFIVPLVISCLFLATPAFAYADGGGYSWTNTTPSPPLSNINWYGLATTPGGQEVIAAGANDDIYKSTDYGSNWTDITPSGNLHNLNWSNVSISANGQVLAATVNNGDIYVSTNGGTSWTDTTPSGPAHNQEWFSLTLSSNGQVLAAGDYTTGNIYTSTNTGATWTNQTTGTSLSGQSWYSISSSANGQILAAADYGNDLYLSTNSGSSWTDLTPSGSLHGLSWESIAMSANGQHMVAVANNDDIYTSNNEGTTWTDDTPSGSLHGLQYYKAASSANGQELLAAAYGEDVYASSDGGTTWTDITPSGTGNNINWNVLAVSASGEYLYGATENAGSGNIYAAVNPSLASTSSATLANAVTGATVFLNLPSYTTILTSDSAVTEGSISTADKGYNYPLGLINLSYLTLSSSDQTSLTFVTNLTPSQVVARDYNVATDTYSNVPGAVITETTYDGLPALNLTYNIADNGSLDSDSAVDFVTDPVGLAELPSTSVQSPNTGYGSPYNLGPLSILGLFGVISLVLGIYFIFKQNTSYKK